MCEEYSYNYFRGCTPSQNFDRYLQHTVIEILRSNAFEEVRSGKHITFKKQTSGKVSTTRIPHHREITVFVIQYNIKQIKKERSEFEVRWQYIPVSVGRLFLEHAAQMLIVVEMLALFPIVLHVFTKLFAFGLFVGVMT